MAVYGSPSESPKDHLASHHVQHGNIPRSIPIHPDERNPTAWILQPNDSIAWILQPKGSTAWKLQPARGKLKQPSSAHP